MLSDELNQIILIDHTDPDTWVNCKCCNKAKKRYRMKWSINEQGFFCTNCIVFLKSKGIEING